MRFLTCSRKGGGDVKIKKAFLIVYGYIRYYHTGVYYSSSLKGTTADVSARATNVHNPWNELTDSRRFVLP